MLETLTELFNQFNTYAKANPVLAGVVSLWGMGVLTWTLRSVPMRVFQFLKRQLSTTLEINNQDTGTNIETFFSFLVWFEQSRWSRFSRNLMLNGVYSSIATTPGADPNPDLVGHGDTIIGVGNGSHFFFYRGRPFWMTRTQNQVQGATYGRINYEIKLTTIGRNRQVIIDLVNEFKYIPPKNKVGIYQLGSNGWDRTTDISQRQLESVVMERNLKDDIVGKIDEFLKSRQWYYDKGLPYKITMLFHGIPGTGKTSIIKALASHFNLNLCQLHLNSMSDLTFEKALTMAPKKSIIVIEDFATTAAVRAREEVVRKIEMVENKTTGEDAPVLEVGTGQPGGLNLLQGLTLSGILNALDGVVALDDKIIILTSNTIEDIDPAILRPGRIDHQYVIPPLTDTEVKEYIELMFPGTDTHGYRFDEIPGARLQQLYLENRNNADAFVRSIPVIDLNEKDLKLVVSN